ncbi:hypothetical protein D9758_009197 [Tetrapyrgos nigripes]|uniref:Uncharacterized protein n=1 Tax=Tetrapyrgos nigripes TaxID=182062 RepID=A0A8H5D3R8_9AGAR|nr:hypothetical protein D9758_009197 [Tetrapyrgos nigripes]
MSQTVIREVTQNVWTFSAFDLEYEPFPSSTSGHVNNDSPFKLGFMPLGFRSTAVKLSNGDVWVHASTPFDNETKESLDKLGPVKYIMNSSLAHHFFLTEFKNAYPNAKIIGVEGISAKKGMKFDGEYGRDSEGTKYGYEDEIKTCFFSGSSNKEVAWYHTSSKTLIVGDLMFNLPATEQFSKSGSSGKLPFISTLSPTGMFCKSTLWGFGVDKEQMKKDIKTVYDWDFERIIMGHGNVIEKDAKKSWQSAWSKYAPW